MATVGLGMPMAVVLPVAVAVDLTQAVVTVVPVLRMEAAVVTAKPVAKLMR